MKTFLSWFVVIGLVGGCAYRGIFSDAAKQELARDRAQARADATPHVIREADGCKVYAFKADDKWHYFTRCSDGTVTTERNWTESRRQGKQTITENKSETIVTKGAQ
ncbi:hypothetical protein [Burkholderia orbicola]|uniref:hypothetical protein n=1 Tax=Burkholderia orbicola TaxID=2978683 RepID=UPI002FE12042